MHPYPGGPVFRVSHQFPVRWTVELGTHSTPEALIADIAADGVKFTDFARGLFRRVVVFPVRGTLCLVAPSLAELGFTKMPLFVREVNARAIEVFGLALSPSEAAFQLRRQYIDQPKGERLTMAFEVFEEPNDRFLRAFHIGCDDDHGRYVGASSGTPRCIYDLNRRMVFTLPSQLR